jgi:hypothetical protein
MRPGLYTDLTTTLFAGACHGRACPVADTPLRVDPLAWPAGAAAQSSGHRRRGSARPA